MYDERGEWGKKSKFQNLDTSNLAANQQNVFEDLTVNTQAADFAAQQQQQAIANTMGSMQGAAGGSGIAALAQAMAGQQSQNLQQASSSIAQQEQANQMAAARGAQQVQAAKLAGAASTGVVPVASFDTSDSSPVEFTEVTTKVAVSPY